MGSGQTVVCVKQVKQESAEEWDETMPLPGDIIEGFTVTKDTAEEDGEEGEEVVFAAAKAKWELSSQLGKISRAGTIWLRVRRGDRILKLRARIAQYKSSVLQRRFTIRAAADDRHVAVLGDLTLEQCSELQELSRAMVSSNRDEFNKRGVKYDWKAKVEAHLPDQRCTVVNSILFMALKGERTVQPTMTRCMAWFTAAVSSGVPLVFVNIQTEQIVSSSNLDKEKEKTTNSQTVRQAIRLWFLPGVREVFYELTPEQGEERFGMDIKRSEEGFIYVLSVTKGSAADRAGLGRAWEEACGRGHLLVVSRLEGKSAVPSSVCESGLVNCCDHSDIRHTLVSAIDRMETIRLHIMAWPDRTTPPCAVSTLRPPM